ncbi:hypothetical protein AGMMS49579_01870 [Spirochaetia bacterium]|nr:hypothetical protein AGMMS49579_01870 [Spirochaetia bacterium]
MVDGALIDSFNLLSSDFAIKWKDLIRKSPQLKHYNAMDDDALVQANTPFYPLLARTLGRGLDRSLVGDFYVKLGKNRMEAGFPVSEVIYGINLSEKVALGYIINDYAPENSVRMYQAMGVVSQVSEFFLLGCFYLTKGFLEATYSSMESKDAVSQELLKKYFKDDFFFKKD